MGNSISLLPRNQSEPYSNSNNQDFTTNVTVHTKRKLEDNEATTTKKEVSTKKRLRTTSQYIYQTLFLNGENSDVTIKALGQEWNLHKVYIRQAGYFSSMFHDQWKESSMSEITLQIPDEMIDKNALSITFGSLYMEEVQLSSKNVIPVLAAASLIQFEGLMIQCSEVMKETIAVDNVCTYYRYAAMYGQGEVSKICIEWLERNLMTFASETLLRELDLHLIQEVIKSPNLLVIQIEMDVYNLVKKWLFLYLNKDYSGSNKDSLAAADNYFRTYSKGSDLSFLETELGQPYQTAFKSLRLQHLIRDFGSSRDIEKDRILPTSWLLKLYREQWLCMLRIEHSLDTGPKNLVIEHMNKHGFRCGRLLLFDSDHCWRWNGFNFGMDILVTYNSQVMDLYLTINISIN